MDQLDSSVNQLRERKRRFLAGSDEEAFYGKGAKVRAHPPPRHATPRHATPHHESPHHRPQFAPKVVNGLSMDADLAAGLRAAADAAATAELSDKWRTALASSEKTCREQVGPVFARGAGRSSDAAALKAGELPLSDRLAFKVGAGDPHHSGGVGGLGGDLGEGWRGCVCGAWWSGGRPLRPPPLLALTSTA